MLSDEDAIEHTESQPNTDAYAKPAAAPIVVSIIVNFISEYIFINSKVTSLSVKNLNNEDNFIILK